jgi:hypothetical protein
MCADVELAPAPPVLSRSARRPAAGRAVARAWRPDWFEFSMLALFAVLSVWVLGVDVYRVIAHGAVWTGTDGVYVDDQLQYLAWIRSAAHHVLASNLFVLRHTPADYFMPAIVISGGLTALGVPAWLSLLLWKPVAVVALFFAVRGYAHRSLAGTWERRLALTLGLFFVSVTIIYGSPGTIGDLFPPFLSWGYTFGLLAQAAMVFALLAYDRARAEPARRWLWAAPALGALASLLHPWQGELLVLVLLGAEVAAWVRERRLPALGLPTLTLVATGLPLLYYLILARTDLSWHLAREHSKHSFSIFTLLLAILPLLLPALVAYARRPGSFLAVMTRTWPVAALVIFFISASNVSGTPLHAFQGITIPLAVLAIEGFRRLGFAQLPGRWAVAALLVAAATVPGTVNQLRTAVQLSRATPGNANFITRDEQHALDYLDRDPARGGVLTRFYLGTLVPAATGRRTFIGDCLWSEPNCIPRAHMAQTLFDGAMSTRRARAFVRGTGARFVLADCRTRADLDHELTPLIESVQHFGCAAVYTLKA